MVIEETMAKKQFTLKHPFTGQLMTLAAGRFNSKADLLSSFGETFQDGDDRRIITEDCSIVEVPAKKATGIDVGHRQWRKNCLCIECKKCREENK